MRLTLTFIICLLFLGNNGQAFAQEKGWDESLDAALNAPYPNDQIIALKALYENEDDAQNKVIAAYHVSSISRELKLFSQAASYAEEAMSLSATHFPGNLQQQDVINTLLVDIYFRSGNQDKALETIDKHLALNDANLDLVWSQQPNGILHRYSSLYCPNNLENLYRDETHIFHPIGIDVGCTYKIYNGEHNAITIYLTRDDDDGDNRTSHQKAMGAVLLNWKDSDYVTQDIELETISGAKSAITETVLRRGSIQKGYYYTGTWTSDVKGWTLKSRVTWDGVLKESFGRRHATKLLTSSTLNIVDHLTLCSNIKVRKFSGTKHEETSALALALTALVANERLKEAKPFERPDKACLGTNSVEGNAVVEIYDSEDHPFAIVGQAITGKVYLSKTQALNGLVNTVSPQYFLRETEKVENDDTMVRIISAYDGLPSSEMVISDYAKMISGAEGIMGSYTENNGESSTINIYVEPENEN